MTNVRQPCRTQQGIADRMREGISVRMSLEAEVRGKSYPAQYQRSADRGAVDVVAVTNAPMSHK